MKRLINFKNILRVIVGIWVINDKGVTQWYESAIFILGVMHWMPSKKFVVKRACAKVVLSWMNNVVLLSFLNGNTTLLSSKYNEGSKRCQPVV